MAQDEDERAPTSLRGKLAAVYFPALLAGMEQALASRLGERGSTYHPLLGAAAGLTSIEAHLTELTRWLAAHKASYEPTEEIIGVDRDVTEGALALELEEARQIVPVAVVMHRKKERQADLRAYHATAPLGRVQAARSPREPGESYVLARDVAEHLAALRLGDADALVAGFESDGHLRDGKNRLHPREGHALRDFYVTTLQSERGGNDWVPLVVATADNGRLCAVEYSTEKLRAGEQPPKEGLMVFERGSSGLFRSVRVYDELGL